MRPSTSGTGPDTSTQPDISVDVTDIVREQIAPKSALELLQNQTDGLTKLIPERIVNFNDLYSALESSALLEKVRRLETKQDTTPADELQNIAQKIDRLELAQQSSRVEQHLDQLTKLEQSRTDNQES